VSTKPRRPTHIPSTEPLLRAEIAISVEELAAAVGIRPARLARLVQLGLVEPATPGTSEFTAATVARLRRMLRLHRDLGVNLAGAAIIVDLLERLERLDAELARLRGSRLL
jgi:chaperone modulatory protein CbpM